jgi:uncharacterized membrane protein YbhN (UPF0104 family)
MRNKAGKALRRMGMVAISAMLLIAAFWIVGPENALSDLARFPVWAIAAVLGLFGLNLVVVTFRLGRILSHFGMALPAGVVARASISGHVAGQFFISIFGQVAGRHLVLNRFGVPSVHIASLTAYERLVLLLVSGGLCLAGAYLMMDALKVADFLADISLSEVALAAAGGFILSFWLGRSRFEAQLISRTHSRANLAKVLEIAAITLVGQLLVLVAFVVGVLVLEPGVDYRELFAAAAIISFAASLPVTVNGWGIRELAAVYTLGQLGIPSSSALAVSILVGLCSTAVILAVAPMVLKRSGAPAESRPSPVVKAVPGGLEIEKTAAWIIATAAAVLIFFQMHVALPGGIANLNLADPFAILALAATAAHMAGTRRLPRWRVTEFNLILAAISALLVFAFLRGALEIGITQWAFAGRLMGWLVLLGYLSVGYLMVSCMGSHGLRRIAETLVATGVVVVIIQVILRWLDYSGWISVLHVARNFEGYADNRNAFAFQMLVCSILILVYSTLHKAADRRAPLTAAAGSAGDTLKKSLAARGFTVSFRLPLFTLLHGIILAGLALSSSRAGLITGTVLLALAWMLDLADRRMIAFSVIFAILVWGLPHWFEGPVTETMRSLFSRDVSGLERQETVVKRSAMQQKSPLERMLSREASNQERWNTIVRGLDMWQKSPVLGAGLGVFIEKSTAWFKRPIVIHSTPVWILAEFGLVGAVLFAWVLFVLVRSLWRSGLALPAHRVIAMLLLVFLVFGLVHEIFYQRIFWLVLGAAVAVAGYTNPRVTPTPVSGRHDKTSPAPLPGH